MSASAANNNSESKARFLLDVVEDRKAVNPVLLDLQGKTVLFDYSLICSGTSNVHIRAIADAVLERAEEIDLNKPRTTGEESAEWVLLDFGDVVVHILNEDSRQRYQLEKFWSTPQPKGALPPAPGSLPPDANDDLDEEDRAEADFFDEADREVEPVDEDDLDDLDDEDMERLDDLEDEDTDEDDLVEDETDEENGDPSPQPLR